MLFGFPGMDKKKPVVICTAGLTNFPLTVKAVNALFMPNPILLKGV